MKILYMLVGLPGSGKSTWIKEYISKYPESFHSYVVISRDKIRFSLVEEGKPYFSKEKEVFDEFVNQINSAMDSGIENIFIDATNISKASREKVMRGLQVNDDYARVAKVMRTPLNECLQRNAERLGRERVPDSAIISMNNSFSIPADDECFDWIL